MFTVMFFIFRSFLCVFSCLADCWHPESPHIAVQAGGRELGGGLIAMSVCPTCVAVCVHDCFTIIHIVILAGRFHVALGSD